MGFVKPWRSTTSSILHVNEVKLMECIFLYCHIWSCAPLFFDIRDSLVELAHDRQCDLRNSVNSSARDKFDTRPLRCQHGDTRAVFPTAEDSGDPYISGGEASEYIRVLPCSIPIDLSRNRLQLYSRPSCNSNKDWRYRSNTLIEYRQPDDGSWRVAYCVVISINRSLLRSFIRIYTSEDRASTREKVPFISGQHVTGCAYEHSLSKGWSIVGWTTNAESNSSNMILL